MEKDEFVELSVETKGTGGTAKSESIPVRQESREVRAVFDAMRLFSGSPDPRRTRVTPYEYKRSLASSSAVFYKQGVFMADFSDDYSVQTPYVTNYPNYQQMTYGQLRTYFTWRTKIRGGRILKTSVSYAFLYIYELLNNIGTQSAQDGLQKLLDFWNVYRKYDKTIDRSMAMWLRDYCVYYKLETTLSEMYKDDRYPKTALVVPALEGFMLYSAISKYDIRRSSFYTKETAELIEESFLRVMKELKKRSQEKGVDLEGKIYTRHRGMAVWTPFKNAAFYKKTVRKNKRIALSEREVYIREGVRWYTGAVAVTGRMLVGHLMKLTEKAVREQTGHKRKLTVKEDQTDYEMEMRAAGLRVSEIIKETVRCVYIERTRQVITVDRRELEQIRREADSIQEKLIVSEEQELSETGLELEPAETDLEPEIIIAEDLGDEWDQLKEHLTEQEKAVIRLVVRGKDITEYVSERYIMPEVIVDEINQKAYDIIGDNIMEIEERVMIYEEYSGKIAKMVKE